MINVACLMINDQCCMFSLMVPLLWMINAFCFKLRLHILEILNVLRDYAAEISGGSDADINASPW